MTDEDVNLIPLVAAMGLLFMAIIFMVGLGSKKAEQPKVTATTTDPDDSPGP